MIDTKGNLARIMNKDTAETFDQSTDSLEAISNAIAVIAPVPADLAVPAPDAAANVLERDVIGNKSDTVASGSLQGLQRVQAANNAANANVRDVVGNKTDAAVYSPSPTVNSLMAILKGLTNSQILAVGTLTFSSATVPADNTRGEATNFWNGCFLIPLTGNDAFQPRRIVTFTTGTGVFTLDANHPFTAATGQVGYIITSGQQPTGMLETVDLWSTYTTQVAVTSGAGDKALQSITIANLPTGAVVQKALMFFKCRNIENTNAAVNSVSGAQNIQAQKAVAGGYITGIALAGGEFSVPASTRESGDVMMGTTDISAQVPANGAVMNFKWTNALAAQNNLNFNDVQVGIRIWFSV